MFANICEHWTTMRQMFVFWLGYVWAGIHEPCYLFPSSVLENKTQSTINQPIRSGEAKVHYRIIQAKPNVTHRHKDLQVWTRKSCHKAVHSLWMAAFRETNMNSTKFVISLHFGLVNSHQRWKQTRFTYSNSAYSSSYTISIRKELI